MNFEKLISASGAPIYYLQMPYAKSVAMGVLVRVGTRDEIWPSEAGIAHAIEHMLFRGTEDFPDSQKLSAYIEDTGGGLNAWTWKEMTFFYNVLPADKPERGVHSLSQMIRKPLLSEEDTEIEMQNVIQEIRRKNDNPAAFLQTKAEEIIYNSHPLGRSSLGTEEAVESFKPDTFREFMQKFYHPANYTFIVVGNFQIEEVRSLFEKYFPENTDSPANSRCCVAKKLSQDKLFTMSRQIEQCHLVIGTLTCKDSSLDRQPLSVFRTMIAGGMSSPLFQEVREKRGLAYEVWASCGFWSDLGKFTIYIGTDPQRRDKATNTALKVVANNKKAGLLKKAKEKIVGRLTLSYNNPSDILDIAASELGKTGKILSFEERIQKIQSVTLDQVKGVCEKYLSEDKLVTVMLLPEDLKE